MAEIYQAIIGAMSDIGVIGKEKKNAQQGFKYRGVDDARCSDLAAGYFPRYGV